MHSSPHPVSQSELQTSLSSSLDTGPSYLFPLDLKSQECFLHRVQVRYLPLCFARDGHYRFHPQLCTCAPHSAQEGRLMWGFKLAPSLCNMLLGCLKRECSIWEANSWSRLRLWIRAEAITQEIYKLPPMDFVCISLLSMYIMQIFLPAIVGYQIKPTL